MKRVLKHAIALLPVMATLVLGAGGCVRAMYDRAQASRPYPTELHFVPVTDADGEPLGVPQSVDVQVFRDGIALELVNATPRTYREFDLWINQRYVQRVDELRAGGSIRLSLWDFWDERGERVNAGGFWRTEEPTPVRMVEIQIDEEQPLVGLITIRAEPAEVRR